MSNETTRRKLVFIYKGKDGDIFYSKLVTFFQRINSNSILLRNVIIDNNRSMNIISTASLRNFENEYVIFLLIAHKPTPPYQVRILTTQAFYVNSGVKLLPKYMPVFSRASNMQFTKLYRSHTYAQLHVFPSVFYALFSNRHTLPSHGISLA